MKPLIEFGTDEQKQRLLPVMAQGGLGSLVITEPTTFTATFKSYGGRAVYDYPADIVKMELALKQAKEAARANGTAKLVSVPSDPNVNPAFSISVTNLLQ